MQPDNTDREKRQTTPATRRRLGSRAIFGGLAVLAIVLGVRAALNDHGFGGPEILRTTALGPDTVPPGDLTCLTRREEDCLETPVPANEPHGAVCSTCHTMWERDGTAGGTIKSCSASGCHDQPESISPFHETLRSESLTDCTGCHVSHSFAVPDSRADCTVCHVSGGHAATQAAGPPARRLPKGITFAHGNHADLNCISCHSASSAHGVLNVAQLEDCQSCHHSSPATNDCVRCHTVDDMASRSFAVNRALDIRIGSVQRPVRSMLFEHDRHEGVACTTCHTGTNLEVPASSDCSSCHLDHHEPTANCATCHERPADGAHNRNSHLGCGGAGCHERGPTAIEWAPRTRALCLACHTDMREHEDGKDCASCHLLPAPGGTGSGRTARD